eukprot:COSAG01_NODE_1063_length_11887_cov_15.363081_2_plen_90_part_00
MCCTLDAAAAGGMAPQCSGAGGAKNHAPVAGDAGVPRMLRAVHVRSSNTGDAGAQNVSYVQGDATAGARTGGGGAAGRGGDGAGAAGGG